MKLGEVLSKSFFALPIFLLLVCGCDVPRDNPNDPYGTTFPVSPPEPAGEIDVSVYSEHVNRLGADADYYWFNIDALITGFCPIDSTNAVLLDNSYPLTLIWGGITPVWKLKVLDGYLPYGSVDQLIGHDLFLDVYCSDNTTYHPEPFVLARVIYTEPEIISPSGGEITPTRPEFSWVKPPDISFPYTYTINVSYQTELNIYYTASGINGDSTSFTSEVSLTEGDNVWWLTIVDEFGNSSISLQKTFGVTNEVTP